MQNSPDPGGVFGITRWVKACLVYEDHVELLCTYTLSISGYFGITSPVALLHFDLVSQEISVISDFEVSYFYLTAPM